MNQIVFGRNSVAEEKNKQRVFRKLEINPSETLADFGRTTTKQELYNISFDFLGYNVSRGD